MLNVYRFYKDEGSGGMLIAAESKERAIELCNEEGLSYSFNYEMTNLKWLGSENIILVETGC